MSELEAQFKSAAEAVKTLPEKPENDMLLRLYGFYKQGSEGDVTGVKPGFLTLRALLNMKLGKS